MQLESGDDMEALLWPGFVSTGIFQQPLFVFN